MKELFKEWGRTCLGHENLEFSEHDTCTVFLSDDLQIDFECPDDNDNFFLYGVLRDFRLGATKDDEDCLLAYNYEIHRESGYRFGYDKESDEYLLIGSIPKSIECIDEFDNSVVRFVTLLEHAIATLREESDNAQSSTLPDESTSPISTELI